MQSRQADASRISRKATLLLAQRRHLWRFSCDLPCRVGYVACAGRSSVRRYASFARQYYINLPGEATRSGKCPIRLSSKCLWHSRADLQQRLLHNKEILAYLAPPAWARSYMLNSRAVLLKKGGAKSGRRRKRCAPSGYKTLWLLTLPRASYTWLSQ